MWEIKEVNYTMEEKNILKKSSSKCVPFSHTPLQWCHTATQQHNDSDHITQYLQQNKGDHTTQYLQHSQLLIIKDKKQREVSIFFLLLQDERYHLQ